MATFGSNSNANANGYMSMHTMDQTAMSQKSFVMPPHRTPYSRRNNWELTMKDMSNKDKHPRETFDIEPDVVQSHASREALRFVRWLNEEDMMHPQTAHVLSSIAAFSSVFPDPQNFSAITGDPTAQDGLAQYVDLWEPWLNKWYPMASQVHVYRTLADRNFFFTIFPIVDDATRDRYVQTTNTKVTWNSYEFTAQAWADTGAHTAGPIDRAEVSYEEQGFSLCEAGYELPIDFLTNPLSRQYYFGFVKANHLSVSMTIELRGILVTKRRAAMQYAHENVNKQRDAAAFRMHYQTQVGRMFGFNKKKGFGYEESVIKDTADNRGLGIMPDTVIVPPGTKHLMSAVRDDTRQTGIFASNKTPVYGWDLYEASKYPFLKGGQSYSVNPLETCLGVGEYFTMGPKETSEFAPGTYCSAFFETALPDVEGDWRWIDPLKAIENSGLFEKDGEHHAFSEYAGDIYHAIYTHCCKERRIPPTGEAAWQANKYDGVPAVCSAGLLYSVTPVYDQIVANISKCRAKYQALLNFIQHQNQKMASVLSESSRMRHMHETRSMPDDELDNSIEDAISGLAAGGGFGSGPSASHHHPVAPAHSGPFGSAAYSQHMTQHALEALSGAPSNAHAGVLHSQLGASEVIPIGGRIGAFRMEGQEAKIYEGYYHLIMEVIRDGSDMKEAFAMLRAQLLDFRKQLTKAAERHLVTDATLRTDIAWALEAFDRTSVDFPKGAHSRDSVNRTGLRSGNGPADASRYPFLGVVMGDKNVPAVDAGILEQLNAVARVFLQTPHSRDDYAKMVGYAMQIMGSNPNHVNVVELSQAFTDSRRGTVSTVLSAHISKLLRNSMSASLSGGMADTSYCQKCTSSTCDCAVDTALVKTALGKCRPSYEYFKFCFDNDIPPPVKCMMLRQNRWRSAAAVWLKRGEETGFTTIQSLARLFDRAPMEFKLHAQTRLRFAVVVHNLRNLYLTPHALASSYLGGLGTKTFFDLEDAREFREGSYNWKKDIFSMAVPLTYEPDAVIDWYGRFSHRDVSGSGNDEQFPGSQVYNKMWGRNIDNNQSFPFMGIEMYKNHTEVFINQRLFGRGCQMRKRKGGVAEATRSVTPYGPTYDGNKLAMLAAMRDTVDDGFIRAEDRTTEMVRVGTKGG